MLLSVVEQDWSGGGGGDGPVVKIKAGAVSTDQDAPPVAGRWAPWRTIQEEGDMAKHGLGKGTGWEVVV